MSPHTQIPIPTHGGALAGPPIGNGYPAAPRLSFGALQMGGATREAQTLHRHHRPTRTREVPGASALQQNGQNALPHHRP